MSTVFGDLPLSERPRAARNEGFSAVESWWPFPDAVPTADAIEGFCCSVEDAGVSLIALNLFGGPPELRGVLANPAFRDDFRRSLAVTESISRRLGTKLFNAPYGPALGHLTEAQQDTVAVENLRIAAHRLGSQGGTVLLEPLSSPEPHVARFPISSPERAAEVLVRVDADHVGLLFDQFHIEANGGDLDAELRRWSGLVSHVQVADVPGRGEPGSGESDIAGFCGALNRAGYEGHVALEFFPRSRDPLSAWREHREAWRTAS